MVDALPQPRASVKIDPMSRRFQFSLGQLLLTLSLLCAAFELGNVSVRPWGPCGSAATPLKPETAMVACAVSFLTFVCCAIALGRPQARPRTTADLLRVAMIVLVISVAAFAFFAKLVHDTHGRRTTIFVTPLESG